MNRRLVLSAAVLAVVALLPLNAQTSRPTVALLDFDFDTVQQWWSGNWDIGQGIADMMVDELVNDGSFRSLKVIVPQGTVVSATKPAAMRWWMTFPMTIIDTCIKAVSDAIPDRTAAAHHADLVFALIHGISPRDGRFYIAACGPAGSFSMKSIGSV